MDNHKNLTLTCLLCFITFTAFSQQNNNDELLKEARTESEKVSEHLDINDDQKVLLFRAIYSYKTGKAKINSVNDLSEDEKDEYLQKMESSFENNVKNALDGDEQLKKDFFKYYEEK